MGNSFKLLKIFSTAFKVIAGLVLLLVLIGVVGILVARDPQINIPQVVLNMLFSGLMGFLIMFSLGEIIRLLLVIEQNTRRPSS